MERSIVTESLRQIIALAEAALAAAEGVPAGKTQVVPDAKAQQSVASSLPDHLTRLRDGGFFSKPKTPKEAHEKVSEDYPCDLNRVVMALLRLQRRRLLRRTGSGKQIAYVW